MHPIALTGKEPLVQEIVGKAFPAYRGRRFDLVISETVDVRSYWSGGSRDYFVILNLENGKAALVPAQSGYDRPITGAEDVPLGNGVIVVEHSIMEGKDMGITIHAGKDNISLLLPAPVELSRNDKIVLVATSSLVSSYGGISGYRFKEAFRETGISQEDWDATILSLISRNLLDKRKAISISGRNAIRELKDLYALRESKST